MLIFVISFCGQRTQLACFFIYPWRNLIVHFHAKYQYHTTVISLLIASLQRTEKGTETCTTSATELEEETIMRQQISR